MLKKIGFVVLISILGGLALGLLLLQRTSSNASYNQWTLINRLLKSNEQLAHEVQETYQEVRSDIRQVQTQFRATYTKSSSPEERKAVLKEARLFLQTSLIEKILPLWNGTDSTYGGPQTERPLEGKIACGYFVSTTLKHAGFKLNKACFWGNCSRMPS